MTPADLLNRLNDRPFKPFRVHLSDGSVLDVTNPGMVILGETSVVLPTMWGNDVDGTRLARRWRTLALAHITQFSDLESSNGTKGKRK
jgi:hypothetical protein